MGKYFFIFCFLLCGKLFAQVKDTKSPIACACNEIGLKNDWAEKEEISCYRIPVKTRDNKIYLAAVKWGMAIPGSKSIGKRTVPLLYLHGGPGIATVDNLPKYLGSPVWKRLHQQHDLIFFDYRGTGYSEPFISDYSDSLNRPDNTAMDANAMRNYELSLIKKFRERLQEKGTDLDDFSSLQNAKDAETIRKALKISTWNVYGVSHGTTVALYYLKHFEQAVRGMILDSPFPPNTEWIDFIRPFNEGFTALEKYIAADSIYARHFIGLRKYFHRAVDTLTAVPVRVAAYGAKDTSTRNYTGNEFAWAIWKAMLNPKYIPLVPIVIKEAAGNNRNLVKAFAAFFNNPNQFGKYSALQSRTILCYEGKPKTAADKDEAIVKLYPAFASFSNPGADEVFCTACRTDTASAAYFASVTSKKPVLLLSGQFDPVCPPLFAGWAAAALPNATQIIVPGGSHAAIHIDKCMEELVAAYLDDPLNKIDAACVRKRENIKFVLEEPAEAMKAMKETMLPAKN